jgi:hypothetical protein
MISLFERVDFLTIDAKAVKIKKNTRKKISRAKHFTTVQNIAQK